MLFAFPSDWRKEKLVSSEKLHQPNKVIFNRIPFHFRLDDLSFFSDKKDGWDNKRRMKNVVNNDDDDEKKREREEVEMGNGNAFATDLKHESNVFLARRMKGDRQKTCPSNLFSCLLIVHLDAPTMMLMMTTMMLFHCRVLFMSLIDPQRLPFCFLLSHLKCNSDAFQGFARYRVSWRTRSQHFCI